MGLGQNVEHRPKILILLISIIELELADEGLIFLEMIYFNFVRSNCSLFMCIYRKYFCPLSVHNSSAVCSRHHGSAGRLQRLHHASLSQPGRHTDGQQHKDRIRKS